jgi:hypothetical protein
MDTSLMNWGRRKALDYVFVYSSASYGDDGLDLGFGMAYQNIDEVSNLLSLSLREHISELIQYSNLENLIQELSANGANFRNNQEILNDFERAVNSFDEEMAEHQLGFYITDPLSKKVFGDSITFTTEDQNIHKNNINLYNAIEFYGKTNEMIEISFNSFVDIYMNYIEYIIIRRLRDMYSDPKAINNIKRVLNKRNSEQKGKIRKKTNKAVLGFSYYQEYHNFSWETTININFFNL